MLTIAKTHYGLPNVPHDIRRLRIASIEHCLAHGQPSVWRHRFNASDEASGFVMPTRTGSDTIAVKKCPACFDDVYGQPRGDCPVCFGSSFVSTANSTTLWIVNDGRSVSATDDGSNVRAPLWRGYGPPVLTFIVEADAPKDDVRPDPRGMLVDLESTPMFAPWYPTMVDGDILLDVTLAEDGFTVESIDRRRQLLIVQPQTIRGASPRKHSRGFIVGQIFNTALVPTDGILSEVTHET